MEDKPVIFRRSNMKQRATRLLKKYRARKLGYQQPGTVAKGNCCYVYENDANCAIGAMFSPAELEQILKSRKTTPSYLDINSACNVGDLLNMEKIIVGDECDMDEDLFNDLEDLQTLHDDAVPSFRKRSVPKLTQNFRRYLKKFVKKYGVDFNSV